MTNIPAMRNALEALENVMKQQEGFIPPMRQAKGGAIAFADFSTVQMATNAMHRLRGLQLGGGVEKGINFSYDKDDSEEKRKEKEARQLMNQAMSKCQHYNCRLCGKLLFLCSILLSSLVISANHNDAGAFCFKLSKALEKMPRRGTDNSYVISEEKYVVSRQFPASCAPKCFINSTDHFPDPGRAQPVQGRNQAHTA
jgi:hypothetical protein